MGAFSFKTQKILAANKTKPEYAMLLKDIASAQQGVVSFSKEVKKYMVEPIRKRYQNNPEISAVIEVLKNSIYFESYNFLEIFQLQDECYFWWCFLQAYTVWKIIQTKHDLGEEESRLMVLVRLLKEDVTVYDQYPVL